MFGSVLIANRGEIACRIIRTLRRLGIESVAAHSEADAGARHVRLADRSVAIGPALPQASYLDLEAVIGAARDTGAEAIHPGYGFLSESPALARAAGDAGVAWVGPPPEVLELTGDKVAARRAFQESGFPVLPGAGPLGDADRAARAAEEVGFPVMVKAVAGGGGIGMGVAQDRDALRAAVETASTRAERFFGDPAVYLERYVPRARHVEVQVLADHARTIHLYERECSVQRRHQKVVEESPSPALDQALRDCLCAAAAASMEAIGYQGAGTVECVLTPEREFFFLEVNARIQVEHPVTEMLTGVDLVAEQLRIAAGEGMSFRATPPRNGHAVECRVYAEDPETFLPSPGRIEALSFGYEEDDVRYDFGYEAGDEVPMHYDPLIGKVIFHRGSRHDTIRDVAIPLERLRLEGPKTNLPRLVELVRSEAFLSGGYDTGILGK